jgi:hypothetical protein
MDLIEGAAMLLIPSVYNMDDETLMKHLENRHADDLRLEFRVEPDRTERRLQNSEVWRTYHETMHRLYPQKYEHSHKGLV